MASRNGSQALADGIRLGFSASRPVDSPPTAVGTSSALAGFEVAFPFEERFSGLGLIVSVGFAASDPAVTSFSLAGFAGGRRPHAPRGRTAIPAAFRYAPAVSRRTPVSCSMRRSGDPSRPRGNHLLFFRFAQDVAHIDEGYMPHAEINVPGLTLVGRFFRPSLAGFGRPLRPRPRI
jgi:hypothetical protein